LLIGKACFRSSGGAAGSIAHNRLQKYSYHANAAKACLWWQRQTGAFHGIAGESGHARLPRRAYDLAIKSERLISSWER
jgi:hypothetical protein